MRKATLGSLLTKACPGIRINEHIEADGPTVFAHACKMGLEGIVSKRKDSTYRSGRSRDWLKSKNPTCAAAKREAECEATVPVALIFSFDALLVFAIVPILMSLGGSRAAGIAPTLRKVVTSIVLNPLLVAAGLGVGAAALRLGLPVALDRLLQFLYLSAAPCALFAIGVTVALRPINRMPASGISKSRA